MATKKAKKATVKKVESCCADSAPMAGIPNIQDWLLIFLGGLGLSTALGYLSWPGFDSYFPVVWSALVLVIGATNLMNKKGCC